MDWRSQHPPPRPAHVQKEDVDMLPPQSLPPAPRCIGTVRELLVGSVAELPGHATARSAIDKRPAGQAVALGDWGLAGDQQADTKIHGGHDKAVHVYPWSHYHYWRRQLPGCTVLDQAGAFGENFSVIRLDESDVCIGDRWAVGSAILEVSQGRQPCWKLNARFATPDMAQRVQNSLRTGWYCRVLRSGVVSLHDTIDLVDRPHPDWSLETLLGMIRDRECDSDVLAAVLKLPLTDSWRRLFSRRRDSGAPERWEARMTGPAGA